MDPALKAGLQRAKRRLDALDFYPEPVRIEHVRVVVSPRFFRLPGFRRFRGYALVRTILVKRPDPSDDLLTHELCHVWQMQQRPLSVLWEQLRYRYRNRPYEQEARRAVELTRGGA